MYSLIINEFIKLRSNKYFYLTLLVILLPPVIGFLILSLTPQEFKLGDINQINITLLGFIGSRTLFPMLAMVLIKLEYESFGFESLFVTPLSRINVILSKIVTAFIWMVVLIVISIIFITISELLFFEDSYIYTIVLKSLKNYAYVLLYALPLQIVGMTLTFVFKGILIPAVLLSFYMIIEYFIHMSNKFSSTPAIISEFIINDLSITSNVISAFVLNGIVGFLALVILSYLVENKEFI